MSCWRSKRGRRERERPRCEKVGEGAEIKIAQSKEDRRYLLAETAYILCLASPLSQWGSHPLYLYSCFLASPLGFLKFPATLRSTYFILKLYLDHRDAGEHGLLALF